MGQIWIRSNADKAKNITDVQVAQEIVSRSSAINANRFITRNTEKVRTVNDADGRVNWVQDRVG